MNTSVCSACGETVVRKTTERLQLVVPISHVTVVERVHPYDWAADPELAGPDDGWLRTEIG